MPSKTKLERGTRESVVAFRKSCRDAGLEQTENARREGVVIPQDAFSLPLAPFANGIVADKLLTVKRLQPKGEWFWTDKTARAGYDARIPVFLTGAKETHQGQIARGYFLGRGLLTKFGVEEAFAYTTIDGGLPADLHGFSREGDVGVGKAMRYHHTATGSQGIDFAFSASEAPNIHAAKFEGGVVGLVSFLAATYAFGFQFSERKQTRAKVADADWRDVDVPDVLRVKWYNEGRAPAKVVARFEAFSPSDNSLNAFKRFLAQG